MVNPAFLGKLYGEVLKELDPLEVLTDTREFLPTLLLDLAENVVCFAGIELGRKVCVSCPRGGTLCFLALC